MLHQFQSVLSDPSVGTKGRDPTVQQNYFKITFLPLPKKRHLHCVPWENNVFLEDIYFSIYTRPPISHLHIVWDEIVFIWQYKQGQRVIHFCCSSVRFIAAGFSIIRISAAVKYSCSPFCWGPLLPVSTPGVQWIKASNRGAVISHWSLTHWNNLHILSSNFSTKQLLMWRPVWSFYENRLS